MNNLAYDALERIFGKGFDTYLFGLGGEPASNALQYALYAFNTAVIVIFTMYLLYQGVVALTASAYEGEPLGKQRHTVWTPLRIAVAIALLAPLPWAGGLSLIQAVVLWLASQGVSFADKIWDRILTHIQTHVGSITPPPIPGNLYPAYYNLLQAATVNAYWCQLEKNCQRFLYKTEYRDGAWHILLGEKTPLGEVVVPCPTGNGPACRLLVEVNQEMVRRFETLGRLIVSDQDAPPPGYLARLAQGYTLAIADAIQSESRRNRLQGFSSLAKDAGFLSAGALFWQLGRLNGDASQYLGHAPQVHFLGWNHVLARTLSKEHLLPYLAAAENYVSLSGVLPQLRSAAGLEQAAQTTASQGVLLPASLTSGILGHHYGKALIDWWINQTTAHGAVVIHAVEFGHDLVAIGNSVIFTWWGLKSLGQGILSKTILGKTMVGKLAGALTNVTISPITIMILAMIYVSGLLLAYVFPLMPFLWWIYAFFGWLIVLIEALVAAPLWSAAHSSGEGEGLSGRRTEQGYMMLLSIVAKPALMLIALVAVFLIVNAITFLLGTLFKVYVVDVRGLNPSFFDAAIYITIFSILLTVVCYKAFQLIHTLPEFVLNWVGVSAHPITSHVASAVERSYGAIVAVFQNVQSRAGSRVGAGPLSQMGQRSGGGKQGGSGGEGGSGGGNVMPQTPAKGEAFVERSGTQGGAEGGSSGGGQGQYVFSPKGAGKYIMPQAPQKGGGSSSSTSTERKRRE